MTPSTMSVCKIMGPMFLKETNSDHSVNLILTSLCRELTEEEKICGSTFDCKYLNSNFQRKLLIFPDERFITCQKIFGGGTWSCLEIRLQDQVTI